MISCGDRPRTLRGLLAITLDGWTGRAPASVAVPRTASGMTAEASSGGGRQGRYFGSRCKAGPARRRKIAPLKPLPVPATPALPIALEEGRAARASPQKGKWQSMDRWQSRPAPYRLQRDAGLMRPRSTSRNWLPTQAASASAPPPSRSSLKSPPLGTSGIASISSCLARSARLAVASLPASSLSCAI